MPPSTRPVATPSRIVCANGELRIATDQKYKPQSWYDVKTSTWKGFDVEVATEIAKRLGVAPAIQHQDWDIVTAGSWNDRWDISVGSMTDTERREQLFYFTPPVLLHARRGGGVRYQHVVSRSLRTHLAGKKVCVGESTTYQSYLQGNLVLGGYRARVHAAGPERADLHVLDTDTDALDQLDLGDGVRCDAASSAVPTIQAVHRRRRERSSSSATRSSTSRSAIAFDKNDPVDNQALVGAVEPDHR